MSNTVLNINTKHEVDNYPYGNLRTKAFFSVEFKPKKGFRHVFQTINPKTDRLNKPKPSTYYTLCWNELNSDNGHIETKSMNAFGYDDVNKIAKFLSENNDKLQINQEMIKDICGHLYVCVKGNAMYTPADKSKLADLLKPIMTALVAGFNTGVIDFSQIAIDTQAIEAMRDESKAVKFSITTLS